MIRLRAARFTISGHGIARFTIHKHRIPRFTIRKHGIATLTTAASTERGQ